MDKSYFKQKWAGGVDNFAKIGDFTTIIGVWGRVLTWYHEMGYK